KNVYIGRKVEIKKHGTEIKIRIKPDEGKTAGQFTYVESIPKGCIEDLTNYLDVAGLLGKYRRMVSVINDPVIVWNFGNEQITDKKEVEYELNTPEDCMRIINSLGFGDITG
ncbi:MAG: hypothetical protein KKC75_00345, partial [Nanoarchaeota archaeon]|nr:hypothetical protein [Nanoarchaeota archaeon]MBU1945945.1 hypothetical protein [Nanoarchaeota archaeon]